MWDRWVRSTGRDAEVSSLEQRHAQTGAATAGMGRTALDAGLHGHMLTEEGSDRHDRFGAGPVSGCSARKNAMASVS